MKYLKLHSINETLDNKSIIRYFNENFTPTNIMGWNFEVTDDYILWIKDNMKLYITPIDGILCIQLNHFDIMLGGWEEEIPNIATPMEFKEKYMSEIVPRVINIIKKSLKIERLLRILMKGKKFFINETIDMRYIISAEICDSKLVLIFRKNGYTWSRLIMDFSLNILAKLYDKLIKKYPDYEIVMEGDEAGFIGESIQHNIDGIEISKYKGWEFTIDHINSKDQFKWVNNNDNIGLYITPNIHDNYLTILLYKPNETWDIIKYPWLWDKTKYVEFSHKIIDMAEKAMGLKILVDSLLKVYGKDGKISTGNNTWISKDRILPEYAHSPMYYHDVGIVDSAKLYDYLMNKYYDAEDIMNANIDGFLGEHVSFDQIERIAKLKSYELPNLVKFISKKIEKDIIVVNEILGGDDRTDPEFIAYVTIYNTFKTNQYPEPIYFTNYTIFFQAHIYDYLVNTYGYDNNHNQIMIKGIETGFVGEKATINKKIQQNLMLSEFEKISLNKQIEYNGWHWIYCDRRMHWKKNNYCFFIAPFWMAYDEVTLKLTTTDHIDWGDQWKELVPPYQTNNQKEQFLEWYFKFSHEMIDQAEKAISVNKIAKIAIQKYGENGKLTIYDKDNNPLYSIYKDLHVNTLGMMSAAKLFDYLVDKYDDIETFVLASKEGFLGE